MQALQRSCFGLSQLYDNELVRLIFSTNYAVTVYTLVVIVSIKYYYLY